MLCNLGVAITRKSKLGNDIENVVRQKLSLYFGHTVVSPFCKEKVVLKEEQTSLERDNLLVIYYLSTSEICSDKICDLLSD